MFGAAPANNGLMTGGNALLSAGSSMQQGAMMLPQVVQTIDPIRVETRVILPRPVYRQTLRSNTRVQPRSWARSTPAPVAPSHTSHTSVTGSPRVVRPVQRESPVQPAANSFTPRASVYASPQLPEAIPLKSFSEPYQGTYSPSQQGGGICREQLSPTVEPLGQSVAEQERTLPSPALVREEPSPLKVLTPQRGVLSVHGTHTPDGQKTKITSQRSQVIHNLEVQNSHGSIVFDGACDLTDVDIAEVVVLKYQEVELYPSPLVLPRAGLGLNRPATISLYQMNPEFKGQAVQATKFEKMLKKSNQKQGAIFVSYVETTEHGWVWTFKMSHFNKEEVIAT